MYSSRFYASVNIHQLSTGLNMANKDTQHLTSDFALFCIEMHNIEQGYKVTLYRTSLRFSLLKLPCIPSHLCTFSVLNCAQLNCTGISWINRANTDTKQFWIILLPAFMLGYLNKSGDEKSKSGD